MTSFYLIFHNLKTMDAIIRLYLFSEQLGFKKKGGGNVHD